MNKQEMTEAIKKEMAVERNVLIWDVLDWVDKNCNWIESKELVWMNERDLKEHKKLIITIYNYFIWRYRLPVEKQEKQCIEFVFDLINKKLWS